MPSSDEIESFKHALPRARVVERVDFITKLVGGKRVAHVGFVDSRFRGVQDSRSSWLHYHLAQSANEIVGLDLDTVGVDRAREEGWKGYSVDCRDPNALLELGLGTFDVLVAGEVIEHIDDTSRFLDGLHALANPNTVLCVTTPNAYSATNVFAAFANTEIMHPDHVALYSYKTLTEVMRRHGWVQQEFLTYVSPSATLREGSTIRDRMLLTAFNGVLKGQGVVARLGFPFIADGLIAVATPSGS